MKTINRIICSLLLASACSIGAIAQENQSYFLHTIEKGQSLYSIASMYGVSQSDIIKLNPGSDEKIFIGRTLRIPRSAANIQKETYHTIETGETLYRLTVKYNVSAKAICDANPGLSAENFRIGQVIRIPSTTETQTMVPAETQSSTVVANNNILGPVESRCRDMHKVKRKETVFSISREYGISEAELIAANPELKGENKIKKGTFLCIPYPKAQTEQNIQSQAIPTDSELFRENRKKTERFSTIKAAVILPFLDGVSKSESSRMVEYYEGLLMAVDSLKRTGTSIDLYTYNSGPESASLNSILGKSEMKDMDIIFGPLYQQHIKPLAEFAKKQDTRLVIPFTSKDNTVFQNPAVYQINTPQSYLYSEVYDHFVRQFPNANVIFIEASQGAKDKAEFIKGLKDELRNRSIPMKSLKEDVTVESLKTVLRTDRENIFIPTSGSNLTLIKILPQLTLLVREQPESRVHLFGYPEWQTYTKDHLEAFFELDTYFYSSFYTNNQNPAVYQINTPQSYLYSEVYDHFVRQFPNANVIFIEASQGAKDKAEFIKGLKDELRNRSIPMKSLKEDVTVESLKTVLRTDRENIFIPTSGSNLTLIKILPQLTLLVREQPESRVHLFGYPEWQTYTKDHLEAFFELDTYFYSSFYTNNLLPAAINFTKSYRRWYGKEMDERYPKFGMLGFDTGYFFLKGLARYGSSFEKNMQGLDLIPIQTGFKFQRVNNWGGFINKKVFFVHFTKNFELVKLDFD